MDGKISAVRVIDDAAWAVLGDESARDRIEALFATKAFARFLAAWPRKSSAWFEVVARALVMKAAKAADIRTAERMCELLASRVFRQGLDRMMRGAPDFDRLADHVIDLLDLAGAGGRLPLDYVGLASSGALQSLRGEYAIDAPAIHDYFKDWAKRAVAHGAGLEAACDFVDLLVSDDLRRLSRFAQSRPAALPFIFGKLFGQWLEGDAKRKSVELKLKLLSRIVASVKLEGIPRKQARLGVALAFARLFATLDSAFDEALARFAKLYGFNKKAEGPAIWERLEERPDLYTKELTFFCSDDYLEFADRVRMECGPRTVALFSEFFFANIEGGRIEGLSPEALRVLPSVILGNRDLFRDRAFWKNRAELLSFVTARNSSFRLRVLFLRAYADEIVQIARGAFAFEERRMRVKARVAGFATLLSEKLEEIPTRPEPPDVANSRFEELFKAAEIEMWQKPRQRLGELRGEGFRALYSLARSLDLDDYAQGELEAVEDRHLDAWLEPICIFSRRLGGMDVETVKAGAMERMARSYWHRLHFGAAYPYIAEMILPVTGAISCLPDEERNIARTDGKTIWLPRYISDFEEDPRRLPDNRNLTIYAGLALHEASHIVAGTFSIDWKPLMLSLDKPLLIHSIFNALEDYRVERYLCRITQHPQVPDIIEAMNIFLYANPTRNPVFDFLMTAYARAAGHWKTMLALNPDHAIAYDEVRAAPYPAGRHGSVEALGEWLADELANMNPCDPGAAMRLARELYDSLRLWPLPEIGEDPRCQRRAAPTTGRLSASEDTGDTGQPARVVASQTELEALAEAFEEDPEACLRTLGIDPKNLAEMIEGESGRKAQPLCESENGEDDDATALAGESTAIAADGQQSLCEGESEDPTSTRETRAKEAALGDGSARPFSPLVLAQEGNKRELEDLRTVDTPEARALERIVDGAMRGCAMAGYRETGELKPASYGKEDREEVSRQKKGAKNKKAEVPDAAESRKKTTVRHRKDGQARPGSRIVKSSAATSFDSLLRVCHEQPIVKVSREFLAANRRYDGFARKLGHMLSHMIQDSSETKSDSSATDGDIDDERLIEVLADPRRQDPSFFEFFDEERRTMTVVIGLDISGSTACRVAGSARNRPRVIDVEKHFSLIFMRALRLLTDDITVLAFNSVIGTTIYRPDPPEALSSFTPGAANRDGDFVRYCIAELGGKDRDLRYLFLISDGMPSASGYSGLSALDDTILSFREARKAGVRIVYLNIDSGALEYFDRFAAEAVYARRFRHPEDLILAAPGLARSVAKELL